MVSIALKSLMFQLTVALVIITSTVLALFGYLRFTQISKTLESQLTISADNTVVRLAFSLSLPYFNFNDLGIENIILSEMKNPEIVGIYIYEDKAKTLLYGFQRIGDTVKPVTERRSVEDCLVVRHDIQFENQILGDVEAIFTRTYLEDRLLTMLMADVYQIVILDVILIILMVALLRSRILKPIRDLTQSTSEISDGHLDKPINISRNDEIGRLAKRFSKMRDAIKKQIADLETENEDRRKAEEALKLSEEKYRLVVNHATEAICVSKDHKIRYVNPEMSRMLGYEENELIGRSLDTIVHPDDHQVFMDSITPDVNSNLFENESAFRVLTKAGDVRLVEAKSVIVSWEDGYATLTMGNDVTERKRTEELMIQTEKMMSVGGLAAGMAHEINNPLGAIMQGAQNVIRRLSPDLRNNLKEARKLGLDLSKLQEYMETRKVIANLEGIRESGKRAAGIISNMLQFSRKSESIMAPIDLSSLIDNTIELANNDYDLKKKYDFRKITIERQFAEQLQPVPCMETEIEQVLLNLIRNAAQALVDNPEQKEPRITIRLVQEEKHARLEVEDNGPGMEENVRKRIFEPFYTTKTVGVGTGLGLSVSYMIITNNHKGTMEVVSEEGKGARFIIRLLLEQEAVQQPASPSPYNGSNQSA